MTRSLRDPALPGFAKERAASGSPWENGYLESFNARLHDELLNTRFCVSEHGTAI